MQKGEEYGKTSNIKENTNPVVLFRDKFIPSSPFFITRNLELYKAVAVASPNSGCDEF